MHRHALLAALALCASTVFITPSFAQQPTDNQPTAQQPEQQPAQQPDQQPAQQPAQSPAQPPGKGKKPEKKKVIKENDLKTRPDKNNRPETAKSDKPDKKNNSKPDNKSDKSDDITTHPLVAQIDTAIALGQLIDPPGQCAWDLFQILVASVPNEPAIKPLSDKLYDVMIASGTEPLRLYAQGVNHGFTRDEWARALVFLQHVRELRPKQKELASTDYFYQAMISLADKQPTKAEELIRKGLKEDDKAPFLYNALGRALSDQKRDEDALKAYQKASALAPQWTYPLVNAAIKHLKRGELQQAAGLARTALTADNTDTEAHATLGAIAFTLASYDEAGREYEQVVLLRPNSVNDHIMLGRSYFEAGSYAKAEQAFTRALQLSPLDPRVRLYLSIVTKKLANTLFDQSVAQIKEALQKNDDPQLRMALADAAAQGNDPSATIESYQAILKQEPWQAGLRMRMANLLLQSDRLNDAMEEYRTLIKSYPDSKELLNGYGLALKRSGNLKDAIVTFRKSLTVDPGYLAARYNLGAALQENGEWEAAATEYRAILSVEPANEAAAAGLKSLESRLPQTQPQPTAQPKQP